MKDRLYATDAIASPLAFSSPRMPEVISSLNATVERTSKIRNTASIKISNTYEIPINSLEVDRYIITEIMTTLFSQLHTRHARHSTIRSPMAI